eukprot:Stramenopile-MAST_4_protein_6095
MNAPERKSSFVLDRGQRKITYEADTRIENGGNFVINKEDHTIGNLLVSDLVKNEHIKFAAYQKPHALLTHINLKVATDGAKTPLKVMIESVKNISELLDMVDETFGKELKQYQDNHQPMDSLYD